MPPLDERDLPRRALASEERDRALAFPFELTLLLPLAFFDLTDGLFALGDALAGMAKAREEIITKVNRIERVLSFGRATDVIVLPPP